MNKQSNAERLEVAKAWVDGKAVEYSQDIRHEIWHPLRPCMEYLNAAPSFFNSEVFYRIKPQPKIRPWVDGEAPVGAVTREKTSKKCRLLIVGESAIGLMLAHDLEPYSYEGLLSSREWSWPNTDKWNPCGVEEKE